MNQITKVSDITYQDVADYIRSLKDRGCEIIEFYGSDYFEFTMPNATKN